jgi:acyl dehydratase
VLPHAYPFRFVERATGPAGEPALAWTVNGALARGAAELPSMLAIEMMAQSALVALPAGALDDRGESKAEGTVVRGLLAGVDGVAFLAPLRPGDALRARAEVVGRFGRLIKARVTLSRVVDATVEPVAEGELLLALEEGGGEAG